MNILFIPFVAVKGTFWMWKWCGNYIDFTITIDTVLDDVVAALLCKLLPNYATTSDTAAEEENKLLLAIIKTLNVSDQRHEGYSELAIRCLYHLSGGANGKFDWQDCSDLVEEYYTNFVKGKIT